MSKYRFIAVITAITGSAALVPAADAQDYVNDASHSTVYTMSNDAAANSILVFTQDPNGGLVPAGAVPTGGVGSGAGLGNQGAVVHDDEYLYAVNAGSNEVSVLRFTQSGLELADVEPSGGVQPVSVTVNRGIVYVLNAGSDSIAGFTVAEGGDLVPLPGSVANLTGVGTGAAQIDFSQDGRVLVVTEKATNSLETFALDHYAVPIDQHVFASPGATPFGFAVGPGRRIYVSEAAGGAENASSVTSWSVGPDGTLDIITPTAQTLQSAACWVAITPDGRFAYTTNAGSGSISAFRIRGGQLDLLDGGVAAMTGPGSSPLDMAVTGGGRYLHVLNSGTHAIATFAIAPDGGLSYVGEVDGLPASTNGLAAR